MVVTARALVGAHCGGSRGFFARVGLAPVSTAEKFRVPSRASIYHVAVSSRAAICPRISTRTPSGAHRWTPQSTIVNPMESPT
jgi:hypothetical protein